MEESKLPKCEKVKEIRYKPESYKYKVGDLAIISAGQYVWCIDIQDTISFLKDTIVEVVATCMPTEAYFVKRKILLGNSPGSIPGVIDGRGEFGPLLKSELTPYTLPKPVIFECTYNFNS